MATRRGKTAKEQKRAEQARKRAIAEKRRIEEQKRAEQARKRAAKEKKRSRAQTDRDPASLYRSMVKAVEKYKRTGAKVDYSRYRSNRNAIYKTLGKVVGQMMALDACIEAGWDLNVSARFAKFST